MLCLMDNHVQIKGNIMKTSTKVTALNVAAIGLFGASVTLGCKGKHLASLVTGLAAQALVMKSTWVEDEDTIARASAGATAVATMDIEKIIANAVAASRAA